jgi:hypothetical protein
MELLIVPFVLAGSILFLHRLMRGTERKRVEENAKLEREIATDGQQEAALQAYLDHMAELLLEKNLQATENEEVRNAAKLRTLSVLDRLDGRRRGLVLRFLKESALIEGKPIIDLNRANLERADLERADLQGANLDGADLQGANLINANLKGANLINADLKGANLYFANLEGTILINAALQGSNLERANLSEARLLSADLSGANLSEADLSRADLRGAKVTGRHLATARSLQGAIMPDGTKHE